MSDIGKTRPPFPSSYPDKSSYGAADRGWDYGKPAGSSTEAEGGESLGDSLPLENAEEGWTEGFNPTDANSGEDDRGWKLGKGYPNDSR